MNNPVSQFIGKALTHLARTNPEILRELVPQLKEDDRQSLQESMRWALQQQQQTGPSSTTSTAPIQKIDINKYKKG